MVGVTVGVFVGIGSMVGVSVGVMDQNGIGLLVGVSVGVTAGDNVKVGGLVGLSEAGRVSIGDGIAALLGDVPLQALRTSKLAIRPLNRRRLIMAHLRRRMGTNPR